MKPIDRNIPLLLLRARESMMTYFRPGLYQHQLTEQQWRIVRALYEKTALEPHELCEVCCILSPSMAGILKRMEELKLIVKIPSSSDKRRVKVILAQGVDKIVEEILEINRIAYREMSAKIGEHKLCDLVNQLDEILEKLEV